VGARGVAALETEAMPDPIQPVLTRPSAFAADANGDGGVTLGDLPGWLAQLFFLPGDWSVWVIAKYAPLVASLVGSDTLNYGGFVSGFIAVAFWSLVLIVLGTGYAYVVELDRRATRASSRIYGEMRRVFRVASHLLRARLRRSEPREERVTPAKLAARSKRSSPEDS
jgi:hypothetical protein